MWYSHNPCFALRQTAEGIRAAIIQEVTTNARRFSSCNVKLQRHYCNVKLQQLQLGESLQRSMYKYVQQEEHYVRDINFDGQFAFEWV